MAERLPDIDREEKKEERLTSGQWLWKTAKPIGCIIILAMFILSLVLCFTYKG